MPKLLPALFSSISVFAAIAASQLTAEAQSSTPCTVSGFIYRPDGTPAAGETVSVVKVEVNGLVVPGEAFDVQADGTGFVSFQVDQNSEAWLRANNVIGLSNLNGVPFQIPNASTAPLGSLWAENDGVTSFNGQEGDITGVSSFNGKQGNVTLGNTDVTGALGYAPVSPLSIIAAINSTLEATSISDSHLSTNVALLNSATNSFLNKVLIGSALDKGGNLNVQGTNVANAVGLTVTKGVNGTSALDLYSDNSGPFQFAMRLFTPETPPQYQPRLYINSAGGFYTNAWMVISGNMGNPQVEGSNYIHAPSNEPSMLSLWSDILGPALQVRGSGGKGSGSYLFSGLDFRGWTTFSIEEDGQLRWGMNPTRAGLDTTLYRASAGVLKTDGTFQAAGDLTALSSLVAPNYRLRGVTRALPTAVNSAVDIGTYTLNAGGGTAMFTIMVTVPSPGYSVAKQYSLPVQWNLAPANTWAVVNPTATTAPYNNNDFALDAMVSGGNLSLRLRTISTNGLNPGTASVVIQQAGNPSDVFTPSTAVNAVTAPTQSFASNSITQSGGAVGINTTPSADAEMDVNGGDTRGLRLRPRSTSGAPISGTWNVGTLIIDSGGVLYVCTKAGAPGTWQKVGAQ